MSNKTTRIAVLAIAGMLLTACGGGGDGDTQDTTADAKPAAEKTAKKETEDTAGESAAGSGSKDEEQAAASGGGTATFTMDGQTWQGDLTECTESFGSITAEGPVESDDGSAYIHVLLFDAPGANRQTLTFGLYPDEEQRVEEILFRAGPEYDDGQPRGEGEGSLTTGDKSFEAETLVYDDRMREVGLGTLTVTCE